MLSEQEVRKSWQRLFADGKKGEETYVKAEALLDELRAESPLRHRLSMELQELRAMHAAPALRAPKRKRTVAK